MDYTNIFESNQHQQGERATEKAHRKIELQSPDDLTHIVANVSRAAREKIDEHLPPDAAQGNGEDAMRVRVEQLVDEYIRSTFAAAKDSMTINGMDTREVEAELAKAQEGEEIEPHDTKLVQRIQALTAQIDEHTLYLASARRDAPAKAAARFRTAYARTEEEDAAQLRAYEQARALETNAVNMDVTDGLERLDEMQRTWTQGVEGLAALKTGMGGTIAKMEKAQKAVEYLDTK